VVEKLCRKFLDAVSEGPETIHPWHVSGRGRQRRNRRHDGGGDHRGADIVKDRHRPGSVCTRGGDRPSAIRNYRRSSNAQTRRTG